MSVSEPSTATQDTTAGAVVSEYRSIDAIRAANKRAGHHFFDRDAMRFFRSTVGTTVYGGRYFITGEQFDDDSPRLYTIREAAPDGTVETVGPFQGYNSTAEAAQAIRALIARQSA